MDINEDNHEAAAVSAAECGIRWGPSKKWSPTNTTDGCFDCNICLDSAHDPVVTMCGHLYCWPCIYKWLHHKGDDDRCRRCPVCNVGLSESMMVPLYGRGGDRPTKSSSDESGSHTNVDIPHRPSPSKGTTEITLGQSISVDHHRHSRPRQLRWDSFYNDCEPSPMLPTGLFRPSATSTGGTAFLVLPWVFGCPAQRPAELQHYSYPYHLVGGAISAGDRRQMRWEAASIHSLRRISAFLVCCLIMCLLMF
ncbi:hypothetical protein ACLOJK_024539 [Asimina triloba]